MKPTELENYLNHFLQSTQVKDYAPNGLQIEGAANIDYIITAVTASQAAINKAIVAGAQGLLVHHGYFWKGETPVITGIKKQRIAALLNHNINLFAYHLPLDLHPQIGNNFLFSYCFSAIKKIWQSTFEPLIWHAEIAPCTINELLDQISLTMNRQAISVGTADMPITRIAWCTGAAQDYFTQAVKEGAQVFISGEYAERTYHEAIEMPAVYISCGHHASERAGIRMLGEHLSNQFGIKHHFFDEVNPF